MITKSDNLTVLIHRNKLEHPSYINQQDAVIDGYYADDVYSKAPKNVNEDLYIQQEIPNTTFKIVDIIGFVSTINSCNQVDRVGLDFFRLMIVKVESEENHTLHVILELEEVLNYMKSLLNPEIQYNNEFVFLNITANKTKLIQKSMENRTYKQYIDDSNVTELGINQLKSGKLYKIEKIKANNSTNIYYDYAVNIGEIFIPVFEKNNEDKMVIKKYIKTNIIYYGILSEINELTKEKINEQIIKRFINSHKQVHSLYNDLGTLTKNLKTNVNKFYEHVPEKYQIKKSDKLRIIETEEISDNNIFNYSIQEMDILLGLILQNNTQYMERYMLKNHQNKSNLRQSIVETFTSILGKIRDTKEYNNSESELISDIFSYSYVGLFTKYIMYYTLCSKLLINKQLTTVLLNDSFIDLMENNLEKLLKKYN